MVSSDRRTTSLSVLAFTLLLVTVAAAAGAGVCSAQESCEAPLRPSRDNVLLQAQALKLVTKHANNFSQVKAHSQGTSGCSTPQGCRTIEIMSYNTEYRHYNAKMGGYAEKIKEISPAIVGLQECQNRDGLAGLSGYTANRETGRQNYMLFNPNEVSFVSGGSMRIPRDKYAERFITWGIFMLGDVKIFFFNTHLPHNHNEAASKSTHARIANMFLQKRRELGAEDAPTVVVGDMNSHASNFNSVPGGGFESNLRDNGFVWAYTAKGHPGYPKIDQILYSAGHWTHSNCRDVGTGGSDHTAITCDLTLTSR